MSIFVNQNFYKEMDKREEKGLLSISDFLQKAIKKKVGRTGGTSSPGQPPNKQSGVLWASIKKDNTGINRKVIKVGTDEDYGVYLEIGTSKMASRPYMRNTFRENKSIIEKVFEKGAKK